MHLKYRPDIDGLRALAVISVIVYHLNNHWLPGGFIGVDVFFVISGFLITKIIYREIISNQFSFKNFYQRRINRILPVFFSVMLCTSFVAWYLLLPDEFMLFLRSLKSTTYFWENMFFAKNTGGYWDSSAEQMPILHTWSLAVEEQFYILLPLILLLLLKIRFQTENKLLRLNINTILLILFVIAIISFALAQISPKYSFLNKYNYYSLFTGRAGELLIGSIVGILQIKIDEHSPKKNYLHSFIFTNIFTIIGSIALIFSFLFISKKYLFPSIWTLIPTLGTALILYFYHPKSIITRIFSLIPLVYIGKISYSLYLWHWPIIVLAKKYLFIEHLVTFKHYAYITITCIILSILSFYFIEKPCRKNNKSFKFSLIIYYILPSLLILSIYYIHKKNRSLDFRFEKRIKLYNLQKQFLDPQSNFCHNVINDNCIFGDTSKEPSILLIGDSNAAHYGPYLDEAGKYYHFSVKIITNDRHVCAVLPDERAILSLKEFENECTEFIKYLNKAIDKARIIIFTNRQENLYYNIKTRFILSNSLPKFIDFLNKKGKKVIFLAQVPMLNANEYDKYYYYFLINKTFDTHNMLSHIEEKSNNFVYNIIKNKALYFNPLNDLDENSKKSWPIYNSLLAYSKDNNHLNEYVTRQWAKEVLPKQKAFWERIARIANKSN
ncbi:acyltransferase [Apibacter muscae]|uniref:Acyltransferase n=1 Tax=Apibacter muscae TaxID=2509004 RepID=A0A563DI11_9FLAO|nr:acyltransferase family protein [Apibacter muscae]TWP29777.1 acyltransferase [Apibacter muscae]TWP30925.1 acyltransferase [Apibacter muscae]